MLFREIDEEVRNIPEWVSWLIGFGFQWMNDQPNRRRIALISMPCDSTGAGLVALGAMIQRFGVQDGNDLREHERRINKLDGTARLFDPYANKRIYRGPYIFGGMDEIGIKLNHEKESISRWIILGNMRNWQFEGERPVFSANPVPHGDFYRQLVGDEMQIVTENLQTSDSVVCIAGRREGQKETRSVLESVSFVSDGGEEVNLDRLLGMGRKGNEISRMCMYNTREGANNKLGFRPPQLIVADGARAFLKVMREKKFKSADIIGVFHRVQERVVLESLRDRLMEMEDYYEKVLEVESMTKPSRGIGLALYRQHAEL